MTYNQKLKASVVGICFAEIFLNSYAKYHPAPYYLIGPMSLLVSIILPGFFVVLTLIWAYRKFSTPSLFKYQPKNPQSVEVEKPSVLLNFLFGLCFIMGWLFLILILILFVGLGQM